MIELQSKDIDLILLELTKVKKELNIPNKNARTPKPDNIFKEDITDFLFVLIDLKVNKGQHQMNLRNYPL